MRNITTIMQNLEYYRNLDVITSDDKTECLRYLWHLHFLSKDTPNHLQLAFNFINRLLIKYSGGKYNEFN